MCFNGHGTGSDMWLTLEDGKYVPAPPMVYMPGLRQIQDRLDSMPRATSGSNVSLVEPSKRTPTWNLPQEPHARRSASLSQTPASSSSAQSLERKRNIGSPVVTIHGSKESPSDARADTFAEESIRTQARFGQHVDDQKAKFSSENSGMETTKPEQGDEELSTLRESSDHTTVMGSRTPSIDDPAPPVSPSRSILKKPRLSISADQNPRKDDDAVKAQGKRQEAEAKSQVTKSVSFAIDHAPDTPSAFDDVSSLKISAAEAGAAITRKLVEKERVAKNGKYFSGGFSGKDGFVCDSCGVVNHPTP